MSLLTLIGKHLIDGESNDTFTFTLSDLERSKLSHSDLEAFYFVKVQS